MERDNAEARRDFVFMDARSFVSEAMRQVAAVRAVETPGDIEVIDAANRALEALLKADTAIEDLAKALASSRPAEEEGR